jgi:hypothetical protein
MAVKKKAQKVDAPLLAKKGRARLAGKLTPQLLERLCNHHKSGMTIHEACHVEQISYTAFTIHRSKHPEFRDGQMWKEAREGFIDCLEDKAHSMAASVDNRSPTMIIFMLKSLRRSVYGERVAVNGSVEHNFASSFAAAMTQSLGGAADGQAPTH